MLPDKKKCYEFIKDALTFHKLYYTHEKLHSSDMQMLHMVIKHLHFIFRTLHMLHLICMFHVVPHLDFTPVEMRCLHILIITLWKLSLASRNTQEVLDLLRLVTNICSPKLSFPQLSKISGRPWNSNPTNRLNIIRFCNNNVKHHNKTFVPSRTLSGE